MNLSDDANTMHADNLLQTLLTTHARCATAGSLSLTCLGLLVGFTEATESLNNHVSPLQLQFL